MQNEKIKTSTAVVTSRSGDKSIKVSIDYKIKHPVYGKYVKKRTTLGVHDELNEANVGDVVEVVPSRPYSKTVNWRLVKILEKAAEK